MLELGCGLGAISRLILRSPDVESLDAVDINPAYVERLRRELPDRRLRPLTASAEDYRAPEATYDWAVSVNVLEHLEDDLAALGSLASALRPGGHCLLLVPAHPYLYSSLDRALSHYRRYTRGGLIRLARSTGLEPCRVRHFNLLGAFGWWLNGNLLRRKLLPRGQVGLYARWGIDLSRWIDRLNPFPAGLSLIGSFEKRA